MNNVEIIKSKIKKKLQKLVDIQPKNNLLEYIRRCGTIYKAYQVAQEMLEKHQYLGEQIIFEEFKRVLELIEDALKQKY